MLAQWASCLLQPQPTRGSRRRRPGGVQRAHHWADSPGFHKMLLLPQHQDLDPAKHRLEAGQGQFLWDGNSTCEHSRGSLGWRVKCWSQGNTVSRVKTPFFPRPPPHKLEVKGSRLSTKLDWISVTRIVVQCRRGWEVTTACWVFWSSMTGPRKCQEEVPIHNGLSLTSKFILRGQHYQIPKPAKDRMENSNQYPWWIRI